MYLSGTSQFLYKVFVTLKKIINPCQNDNTQVLKIEGHVCKTKS